MEQLFLAFLTLSNETLTAAAVIVTASLLLYNLTRNMGDRVARSSAVVLACVTITYMCDVIISLDPNRQAYEVIQRLQWIGIALMPTGMFHLSDALLATTGLPSRGRRRRVIRLLYSISIVFIIAAAFTDILVQPVPRIEGIGLRANVLFPVYILFFLLASGIAFINVQRARQRCLTRDTRRRMGYLQVAMLTPVIGIFPFSVILGPGEEFSLTALILVNISNIVVILMLLFLAYPLAFFGSRVPDRVVKTELLRFVLRGPATGLLALVVIIFITPTSRFLGLTGQSFLPFAVVAVVLLWQWIVALILPYLEKRLIYPDEDDDQLSKLQNLSEQLLTRNDLLQLIEAILAASCDYLQVNTAFMVSLSEEQPEIIAAIGPTRPTSTMLEDDAPLLTQLLQLENEDDIAFSIQTWQSYWIVPLYSKRRAETGENDDLIGFIGVQARSPEVDLTTDEYLTFRTLIQRAAQALDDLALQTEIYAALEGLLPQINITRTRAAEVEYRISRNGHLPEPESALMPEREQFVDQVRAALRHYWGGPGLTRSRLLELNIVNNALPENDDNAVKALRTIINQAIESQRPEGERRMTSPEWLIYNILELRFIEQRKVREVANRLALAEATLYRKQRDAIEAVADTLIEMERLESEN